MIGPEQPRFSVVIPTYNRAGALMRAICSVLKQTYPDYEILVVDDGSTDSTSEAMASVSDGRIRYLRQANRGRSAARNAGASAACGSYLVFLDSDDTVQPCWLETLWELTARPNVGIACVGVARFANGAAAQPQIALPLRLGPLYDGVSGLFLAGSFAVLRSLFLEAGGYAEELNHSENTELALRLVPHCLQQQLSVVSADKVLVNYYVDNSLDSRSVEDQLAGSEYILKHHGERYRRLSPRAYANRCSVAGVSAARLGRYELARQYLVRAIRAEPVNWRYYARYAFAATPPLARMIWQPGFSRSQEIGA